MLKGSIVALVTPFNENLEVNYSKLEELIEMQYKAKTDALLLLGSTGESCTLSENEKEEIVRFVIAKNKQRMKIVVAVISNKMSTVINEAKLYEKMGANYIMLISPYYIKGTSAGIINYFTEIASSVNLPIILYNVPSRCGVTLDLSIVKELKKIPNIVGIKESSKDVTQIIDIFSLADNDFSIYCGNDELAILFLSLGAKGLINVYGNYNPDFFRSLFDLSIQSKLLARNYFYKHYELLKGMTLEVNPVVIKALMNYKGMNVGGHRLPLEILNINNSQKIFSMLNE